MACLSWQREGAKSFTVAANQIYLLSDPPDPMRGIVEFEILENDAELLMAHVGTPHVFYLDDRTGVFSAKLSPLVPVTSTHPALALLRGKPTLRGYLEVFIDA
jgi:hypothetical protein